MPLFIIQTQVLQEAGFGAGWTACFPLSFQQICQSMWGQSYQITWFHFQSLYCPKNWTWQGSSTYREPRSPRNEAPIAEVLCVDNLVLLPEVQDRTNETETNIYIKYFQKTFFSKMKEDSDLQIRKKIYNGWPVPWWSLVSLLNDKVKDSLRNTLITYSV